MNGTEQEQNREDIKDKARGFQIKQTKVRIITIPSVKFPKGAKYSGFIFDVLDNRIVLDDTFVMKRIDIYLSEIGSSADIWEAEDE